MPRALAFCSSSARATTDGDHVAQRLHRLVGCADDFHRRVIDAFLVRVARHFLERVARDLALQRDRDAVPLEHHHARRALGRDVALMRDEDAAQRDFEQKNARRADARRRAAARAAPADTFDVLRLDPPRLRSLKQSGGSYGLRRQCGRFASRAATAA